MRNFAVPFTVGLAAILFWGGSGFAQKKKDESPQILLEEFELNEQNVVIAAAKVKTTLQETPAIITIVTSKEIAERGYRTINEVLQNIPGFHGDRSEGNNWFRESFARGVPRGLLILMNGVSIVEPIRNTVSLDRKIPLEIVHRIEVTSGPGGVLWGSNALLGIVNIVTKSAANAKGLKLIAGYGTGPGEVHGFKVSASWGGIYFKKLLKVYANASFFSSQGQVYTTDSTNIYGVLPAPTNAGLNALIPGQAQSPLFQPRSYWFNFFAKIEVWKFSFEVNMPWERDHLLTGAGGQEHLTGDFSNMVNGVTRAPRNDLVTRSVDSVRWASIKFKDRFWDNRIGLSTNVYYTDWAVQLTPFGVYPYGTLAPTGVKTWINAGRTYRIGANVDVDIQFPKSNRVILGAEVFFEEMYNSESRNWDPTSTPTTTSCNAPFQYRPDLDPIRPCVVFEPTAFNTNRLIGAVYLLDEWRALSQLILTAGVRGQFSDTYDATVLFSGGLVWNIWQKIFLKLNYSGGFRPPNFLSTHINPNVSGQVTYQANPNLKVERSRAVETQISAIFLENYKSIRRLYLRANYAYTRMSNVITRPGGKFQNSGEQEIHTIEASLRMIFKGGHEFWLGYYFLNGHDSETGVFRNVPNHIFTGGFRANLYRNKLEWVTTFVLRGAMDDLNMAQVYLTEPGATQPYNTGTHNGVDVAINRPTNVVVTRIPSTLIINTGLRVKNIWKQHLEFRLFIYNALNLKYSDADLFNDYRTFSPAYPKARISFFFETVFRYF